MRDRYIELDSTNHLVQQSRGGDIFNNKLWRESYYFFMSDDQSGLRLITTIGILPNRKLYTGLVLILLENKVIVLKPVIKYSKPIFDDYDFRVKGLKYSIEGIKWRLKYKSSNYSFNLLFTPLNKIYSYINEDNDVVFSRIGSQHLEQFGKFEGEIRIKSRKIAVGPSLGHRDHSWGIRDWSSVDSYKLFCCPSQINLQLISGKAIFTAGGFLRVTYSMELKMLKFQNVKYERF